MMVAHDYLKLHDLINKSLSVETNNVPRYHYELKEEFLIQSFMDKIVIKGSRQPMPIWFERCYIGKADFRRGTPPHDLSSFETLLVPSDLLYIDSEGICDFEGLGKSSDLLSYLDGVLKDKTLLYRFLRIGNHIQLTQYCLDNYTRNNNSLQGTYEILSLHNGICKVRNVLNHNQIVSSLDVNGNLVSPIKLSAKSLSNYGFTIDHNGLGILYTKGFATLKFNVATNKWHFCNTRLDNEFKFDIQHLNELQNLLYHTRGKITRPLN